MNSARCARPACSGTPAAWLAYDYDARCAWLDDEVDDSGPQERSRPAHAWPLCERHADTLKVPRGWFCVDRRASRFGANEAENGAEEVPGGVAVEQGPASSEAVPEPEGRPAPSGAAASAAPLVAKRAGRASKGPRDSGRFTSIL